MNAEAKGRYQVQKRITQHENLRVIFGLMPALVFIGFAKNEVCPKCKTEKSDAGGNGFILRASIDLWPEFQHLLLRPRSETCWGVPSPNPAERKKRSFFSHGGVQKMRGPYSAPKRTHVIKARLDDDEYEFFMKQCEVYRMTQSKMIRTSLERLHIHPVIKFSPVNKELLSKIDELITGWMCSRSKDVRIILDCVIL